MRFLQIAIIVVGMLSIILTLMFMQNRNQPQEKGSESHQRATSPYRSAKVFLIVIGISVVVLCTTIVMFHFLG